MPLSYWRDDTFRETSGGAGLVCSSGTRLPGEINLTTLCNAWRILSGTFISSCLVLSGFAAAISEQIIVDQFGWRAGAPRKVVIFANPQRGQNAGKAYLPGNTFQLRHASDNALAFTGQVTAWKNGSTDSYSGDQVWWGDFSSFTTPGEYVIYDPANDLQSYPFSLRNDIYGDVLKTAVRMFYYQRCGLDLTETFGGNWNHAACHIGSKQDLAGELYATASRAVPGTFRADGTTPEITTNTFLLPSVHCGT